ncbi:MAG: YraN family protein [Melioribacteraceae bacterium]|nr:YraN family protein [Melioribacteraceae bacterium]
MGTVDKNDIGKLGENLAAMYLIQKGYSIITRNYRHGHGEIDIIAQFQKYMIFVEVKTRKSLEYGTPEEAVTKSKQKQIRKVAEAFINEHDQTDLDYRLDVIAILLQKNEKPKINHYENAF